jgi:hypothetical protein
MERAGQMTGGATAWWGARCGACATAGVQPARSAGSGPSDGTGGSGKAANRRARGVPECCPEDCVPSSPPSVLLWGRALALRCGCWRCGRRRRCDCSEAAARLCCWGSSAGAAARVRRKVCGWRAAVVAVLRLGPAPALSVTVAVPAAAEEGCCSSGSKAASAATPPGWCSAASWRGCDRSWSWDCDSAGAGLATSVDACCCARMEWAASTRPCTA